ncbi:MAG: hypothetical protein GX616_05445 [Planctomycetes bacterium]|nr:hypothetical protein [Planctomycetota bacterium]
MVDNQNGWKVDLSAWKTMKPIMEWQSAAGRADLAAMSATMAQVIKGWPYEGDPASAATYENLTPQEWQAAAQEVGKAVGSFFQSAAS